MENPLISPPDSTGFEHSSPAPSADSRLRRVLSFYLQAARELRNQRKLRDAEKTSEYLHAGEASSRAAR